MNRVLEGCRRLVTVCGDLRPGETALVISDDSTRVIAEGVAEAAGAVTKRVRHLTRDGLTIHGEEPVPEIARAMRDAQVIFGLTRMSMAHTEARRAATAAGARYLSLPDYSEEVMASEALTADFRALTSLSQRLASILTGGRLIQLESASGTTLRVEVGGRVANACPGWCWGPGTLASPPDAETNIPVLEDSAEGTLVVDGSIPHPRLGLLRAPLVLTIYGGRVVAVEGPQATELEEIYDALGRPESRTVAELGIGLNPLARLRGWMLEDEGCLGTVHLGMGSNSTIGGVNSVPFHLDHIIRNPGLNVDGRTLIRAGIIQE